MDSVHEKRNWIKLNLERSEGRGGGREGGVG